MDLIDPGLVLRLPVTGDDGSAVIDDALIHRLNAALDRAEADQRCRIVLLTSAVPGVFSMGMNLVQAAHSGAGRAGDRIPGGPTDGTAEDTGEAAGRAAEAARRTGGAFFDLLERFTRSSRIVACAVNGQVAGGGVGLVSACDLVLSGEESTFALPEALWGLLPCVVLPFLTRRVGFQKAYAMTITTRPVDARAAADCGLVDDLRADPLVAVRQLAFRAARLDPATIGDLKRYAHRIHPFPGGAREAAVGELGRLMSRPPVRRRLLAYAEHGRYPWEK